MLIGLHQVTQSVCAPPAIHASSCVPSKGRQGGKGVKEGEGLKPTRPRSLNSIQLISKPLASVFVMSKQGNALITCFFNVFLSSHEFLIISFSFIILSLRYFMRNFFCSTSPQSFFRKQTDRTSAVLICSPSFFLFFVVFSSSKGFSSWRTNRRMKRREELKIFKRGFPEAFLWHFNCKVHMFSTRLRLTHRYRFLFPFVCLLLR